MPDYLVDTDVLIDITKGCDEAAEFMDRLEGEIYISRISTMELIFGSRDKSEQRTIEVFVGNYPIAELSGSIGEMAYSLMKKYSKSFHLNPTDAFIAATAIRNQYILVSRNEKHFRLLKELGFLKPTY